MSLPDLLDRLCLVSVVEKLTADRTVDSPVFARGEVDKPGEVVVRGVLQVVGSSRSRITAGSGRKELADWIASRENPLTAG